MRRRRGMDRMTHFGFIGILSAGILFLLTDGCLAAPAVGAGRTPGRLDLVLSPSAGPSTATLPSHTSAPAGEIRWILLPGAARVREIEPSYVKLLRTGFLRGYHLAQIMFKPNHHPLDSGRLFPPGELHITLYLDPLSPSEEAAVFKPLRSSDTEGVRSPEARWILKTVLNPEDLQTFYGGAAIPAEALLDAAADTLFQTPSYTKNQVASTPYGGFNPTRWPSLQGPAIAQVILTDDQTISGNSAGPMTAVFAAYALWKTEQGLPTVVERVSAIRRRYDGFDTAEKIKNYLYDAVKYWGVRWVLLGGDIDIVPTRRLDGQSDREHDRPDPPADIYYVRYHEDWNLDDDAFIWDGAGDLGPLSPQFDQAWIGRLPCRSAAEAQVMVDKIRAYRRDRGLDPGPGYYTSVLLATGPVNDMNPRDDGCGYPHTERVLKPFRAAGWSDTLRLYAMPDLHMEMCDGIPHPCYTELISYLEPLHPTPWTGSALRDRLNDGFHIVWHLEHSLRSFLGNPTVAGLPPPPLGCNHSDTWRSRCRSHLSGQWSGIRDLSKELVYELQNGAGAPRYSIVFSAGSFVNEYDLDAVSEAFLRSPDGGAVAFIGKTLSLGGFGSDIAERLFDKVATGDLPNLGAALSLSIVEAYEGGADAVEKSFEYTLLGDPEMPVWPGEPKRLEIEIDPPGLSSLGPRSISIQLRDGVGGGFVQDAAVCLKQGAASYGIETAGLDGTARFPGFPVLTSDPVLITVTAPGYLTVRESLAVESTLPYLTYDHHILSDAPPGGDGDGLPEAGENIRLHVTALNTGVGPASHPQPMLWASPPIDVDLSIDDMADRESILIGAGGAHPAKSRFSLPDAGHGYRSEGAPPTPEGSNVRLWRDPEDGSYMLSTHSQEGSPEPLFTGTLFTGGGFTAVGTSMETWEDQIVWSGDSIQFQFRGDATDDAIIFRADASDWLSLRGPHRGSLAPERDVDPGDTLQATWSLALAPSAPDEITMPFTLRLDYGENLRSFSDFSTVWSAPVLDLITSKRTWRSADADVILKLFPIFRNRGHAAPDTLHITLRRLSGPGEVVDSTADAAGIPPGGFGTTSTPLLLSAATIEEVLETTFTLEVEAGLMEGSTIQHFGPCGGAADSLQAPKDLQIESAGRSLVLRWSPVEGAVRYLIEAVPPDDNPFLIGFADSTSRYEVSSMNGMAIETYDEGLLAQYRFQIRACDGCVSGPPAVTEPDHPWYPAAPGWPRRVPGILSTAPTVLPPPYFGDRGVVFAAGRKIYAWFSDGAPLRSGEEYADGLFFDPGLPDDPDRIFTEALALFPFDYREDLLSPPVPSWGLAGNVRQNALYVLRLVPEEDGEHWRPELYWTAPVSSILSAPLVWRFHREDLPQILLPSDGALLHAWMADGEPLLTHFPSGSYAETPDGSTYNFRSLAIASAAEPGGFNIIQSTRSGHLICWPVPRDRDRSTLADPLWDIHLEAFDTDIADYSLSSPAVADVDGDFMEEIVVTNQTGEPGDPGRPGRVWVIDPLTGEVEARGENWDWSFRSDNDSYPPPRPALANLNHDGGYEMVIAGRVDRRGRYVSSHRVHILSVGNSEITGWRCTDESILPSRNSGNINAGVVWSEPILSDFDGDGVIEILAPSAGGALFSWEPGETCRPESGWPMIFNDLVMPPTIEDLDGDGDLEMVIACRDATLQVLQLPGSIAASARGGWNQYGADIFNSARVGAHYSMAPPPQAASWPLGALHLSPTPFLPPQRIELNHPGGSVTLSIFDVAGRRVRNLYQGGLDAGLHHFSWDGRDDGGRRVGSGIYFYKLTTDHTETVKRTLLLR
ncbi:MAG: hypothetical protein KJ970_03935 [Candidatus Eisenbacteria bacterium]|uniref:T9SS type A sorting domain-containing protein n=1 Tax=Eiseniibacteriota bacterium TaxID=2212470 RepID=A0A948WBK6_UNCEI|nr:hypothetical protein [Candidatus Eisenbacteria bacterium]MBU1951024.1 hypothetical protein [Candidatus Eisenbacteria bacterium]MBU2690053.1 hypothetical protein [Candidatus Eisenbacteria bacterium]